jgi:NDP-sugar pyrophosphorylase family protein
VIVEAGCTLGKEAFLRNCIVLPGCSVPSGSSHENRIIGVFVPRTVKTKRVLFTP